MAQLDYLSGTILRDVTGAPYLGAKASYWADVGATTPLTTYSDAGLSSANANPVVSDGTTGAFGSIYLQAKRYWRTVTTSAGVSLSQFNLGPIDGFVTLVESATAPSPSYKLMYWYDTTTGNLKRRDSTNSSWLDLGGIDSLINAASVTEQLAGTSTSKASTPDSVAALWQRGTDIASAATLSLPATGGGVYNITGTTGVSAISSAQGGRQLWLRFAGALTLTHNGTSFILPGSANITTVAGDMACFINEAASDASGSNWRCFSYTRSSGSSINITDQLGTQAEAETGTSTTKTLSINNLKYHDGVAKYWVQFDASSGTPTAGDSLNHSSFTDNGVGDFTSNFVTNFSAATYAPAGMNQRPATNSGAITAVKQGTAPTSSAFRFATVDNGATAHDSSYTGIAIWGDFA
jgi:hypothetical protein